MRDRNCSLDMARFLLCALETRCCLTLLTDRRTRSANNLSAYFYRSMLLDRQENTIGKQPFRILLPLNLSGVKEEERKILQEWLDLVDWRESRVRH